MPWLQTDSLNKKEDAKTKSIAFDFDGTLVENDYPNIGRANDGGIELLRELSAIGFKLILETQRDGDKLQEAVVYCNRNNIDLWGVNNNPDQADWNESRKIYATLKIDDRNVGIPLKIGTNGKPCVDWKKVRELFVQWEILEPLEQEDDGTKSYEIK